MDTEGSMCNSCSWLLQLLHALMLCQSQHTNFYLQLPEGTTRHETCQHWKIKKRNYSRWRPKGPTIEAQRADNRGPKGPEIEVQLGGVGSTVSSPTGVWGEAPADFDYGAVWASQMASGEMILWDLCMKNTCLVYRKKRCHHYTKIMQHEWTCLLFSIVPLTYDAVPQAVVSPDRTTGLTGSCKTD